MPPIVPPAPAGLIPSPFPPEDPPTARDVAKAAHFEMVCTAAFAIQYKHAVTTAANLEHAIGPLRNDIMSIRNDITNMQADIQASQQRQADAQRCAARAYNRQVQLGDHSPFEEVPWKDGTYPWGYMLNNQPLPKLTSAEVVRALDNRQSQKYYSGYYPGVNVPDDRNERDKATLIAIGVPARIAGMAVERDGRRETEKQGATCLVPIPCWNNRCDGAASAFVHSDARKGQSRAGGRGVSVTPWRLTRLQRVLPATHSMAPAMSTLAEFSYGLSTLLASILKKACEEAAKTHQYLQRQKPRVVVKDIAAQVRSWRGVQVGVRIVNDTA
ncbi:predicted protein [Postia placenta Mad-698-R]|uniref:Mug135-like C-terminal domain-containing protein n=1 Tax=Postia placenta MAD-698-R-SB12 TaxID=670580 RepID=A0A1X6N568_9APHY|nr:hypothetical protein POSPLADRAFT_1138912 [Postia placenta MAD-698-R-SB12]EED84343.1 predicted protein [Postia placenta Mad-698-R]OSX63758.1 hypothetical protein POSPLADRAFT_1138912 [Postia placenta MAD-698-R-SB12]